MTFSDTLRKGRGERIDLGRRCINGNVLLLRRLRLS